MDRSEFIRRAAIFGGGIATMGPLQAFYVRTARAGVRSEATGYGPLIPKGDLALPEGFNYQIIQHQGLPQRDGNPVPGLFDGMAAFPGQADTTILIRNHENRTRAREIPVVVPPGYGYDFPFRIGGCTKVVVRRDKVHDAAFEGEPVFTYEVVDGFNILGGTTRNCAGGPLPFKKWITCEEIEQGERNPVTLAKHGYIFEVDATSDGPVVALPIKAAGRFAHEACAWQGKSLYLSEDRNIPVDGGACLYRYSPDFAAGQSGNLAETTGPLEALKVKNEFRANMDIARPVGVPFDVEWVTIDVPDHDDETDQNRVAPPEVLPTRFQAQNKGAAFFDRQEGMWTGPGDSKIYFDCTAGGELSLGQVWEYDPGRETITLLYESNDPASLQRPDNVVIVPQTQDIFLCENGPVTPPNDFIRGLTQDGQIYDFAQAITNNTEFCGACFDPDGQTLYVNQQGDRRDPGQPIEGVPSNRAITYAIYGPFEKRLGSNSKDFGTGPAV
jgi:secreted PhoX family phosphatase